MSIPELSRQRSFFDVDQVCLRLFESLGKEESPETAADRFVFFAREVWPRLVALRPRLEAMYCRTNGRPAEEPVRMLAVLILQFMERMPDREAAEAYTYDLRWKLALHLDAGARGFHPSSLARFRERLIAHGLERIAFEGVVQGLIEKGWVKAGAKQRLDSTHIVGLVARLGRLGLVRETIRLALVALDDAVGKPAAWIEWRERYVESKPDYRDSAEALRGRLRAAGRDAAGILNWAQGLSLAAAAGDAVGLLRRVFGEQFEYRLEEVQERALHGAGTVVNPHEPEAQWSTKAAAGACASERARKEWVGYKVQVAETVQDALREKGEPTVSFVTSVVTQNAIESEDAGLVQTLAEQEGLGLSVPSTLYVDAGYVSGPALAEARAAGRELRGPIPGAARIEGRYTSEAFDVDVEKRRAVCPQGNESTNCSRLEVAATGKVAYRFEWSAACRACPARDRCVGQQGPRHRTLVVGEHHTLIQARRREMRTDAFRKEMKHRNGIEGTQSEMVRRYGMRRARYRGKKKVALQNGLIGAACNLRRWFRRVLWESKRRGPAPNTKPFAAVPATG